MRELLKATVVSLEVAVISRGSQRGALRLLVCSASVGTLEGLGGLKAAGRGVGDRVRDANFTVSAFKIISGS